MVLSKLITQEFAIPSSIKALICDFFLSINHAKYRTDELDDAHASTVSRMFIGFRAEVIGAATGLLCTLARACIFAQRSAMTRHIVNPLKLTSCWRRTTIAKVFTKEIVIAFTSSVTGCCHLDVGLCTEIVFALRGPPRS